MSDLDRYLAEQMQDPEFKEYYFEMQPAAAISKAIVAARIARGMTQKELSQLTGVNQGDISRLESCEGNPSVKTLQRIAKGLNMHLKIEFVPISND